MADTQYVAPFGDASTPASWVLPAALQIMPKLAYAKYDGSGAAGAYLPCLRLISDSGHVAAEAVSETSVPAGGSADVTWFPKVSEIPGAITPNTNGTWLNYTPVWAETTGTQPSIGNGTLTGLYYQQAKFVIARIVLTAGTTTTFGNSSGIWTFSLPVTSVGGLISYGLASNSHDATVGDVITWGYSNSSSAMAGWGYGPGTAGKLIQFLNSAQPTTWAASSSTIIRLGCLYEAA